MKVCIDIGPICRLDFDDSIGVAFYCLRVLRYVVESGKLERYKLGGSLAG